MTEEVQTKAPFRADLVGSLLRPERLKVAHQQLGIGEIQQDQELAIQHEAIKHIVKKQVELGFNAVTDGEFSRRYWHLDFFWGLNGFEKDDAWKYERDFKGGINAAANVHLAGKVGFNPDHPFFAAFNYLKSIVPAGVLPKQTIPSPALLFRDHRSDNWSKCYASFDDYLADVVQAYVATIEHFYTLGVRYLQIDDTNWAYLIQNLKDTENDPKRHQHFVDFAKLAHQVIKAVLVRLPEDLTVTSHICRGNFQSTFLFSGGYQYVADEIGDLPYDGLFLEYDSQRAGSFEPLPQLWQGDTNKRIVLGLITSKFPELEDEEKVIERIHAATAYVPLSNLALSTQCGFASTEEGNKLTEDDQWAKLALVQRIAHRVWEDA